MTYKLNLSFSSKDLANLNRTNAKVAIAKPVLGANPNVTWVVFDPFSNNSVSWEEEAGLYASKTRNEGHVIIETLTESTNPATIGSLYRLNPDGLISLSGPADDPTSYSIKNDYSKEDYMTMGVFQNAVVNGTEEKANKTSANTVLLNFTLNVQLENTLYLWIESDLKTNTLFDGIKSPVTKIAYADGITAQELVYNAKTGMFDLGTDIK